jgi:hypothetical protein
LALAAASDGQLPLGKRHDEEDTSVEVQGGGGVDLGDLGCLGGGGRFVFRARGLTHGFGEFGVANRVDHFVLSSRDGVQQVP